MACVLAHLEDRDFLGPDEVCDDLLDDADDLGDLQRPVEPVCGDVEIGEVVVLLFDRSVIIGCACALDFELIELVDQPLALYALVVDLHRSDGDPPFEEVSILFESPVY